jgi:Tfp pilus assembly protein PilO
MSKDKASLNVNTQAIRDTVLNFIVPLVAIVSAALLGFLVFYPSYKEYPRLRVQVQEKQALHDLLSKKLAVLNKLLDYKSVVDEDLELITGVLMDEAYVPELLTQIDIVANEAGLEVTKLNYSFVDLGSAPGGANPKATDTSYKIVSVALGVKGTYEQMMDFYQKLETSARLIDVETFRYSGGDEEEKSLMTLVDLRSPYLKVESTAVTDDAVTLDITDPKFLSMISKIKELRFYRISVDSIRTEVVEQATEVDPAAEVPAEEPAPAF